MPEQTPMEHQAVADEMLEISGAHTELSSIASGSSNSLPPSKGNELVRSFTELESLVPTSTTHESRAKWSLSSLKLCGQRLVSNARGDQSGSGEHNHKDERRDWRQTLIRFGPLSGIFAALIGASSVIASLGILAGSNGSPVNSWPTPPSTYIAIFTALGNLGMRYATIQGVIIAWWVKALKGSSLGKLHRDWRAGTSIRGAVMAGRHMGWLGVACIFSTLVIVDGPLVQRASTVIPAPIVGEPVTLELVMVPEIPTGYTGTLLTLNSTKNRWDQAFNKTIPTPYGPVANNVWDEVRTSLFSVVVDGWVDEKSYHHGDPIAGGIRGCPGHCEAKMLAPALVMTKCVTQVRAVNFSSPWPIGVALASGGAPPLDHEAFIIETSVDTDGTRERLNLITAWSTSENCVGELIMNICTLESAVGEYNVTIDNNAVTVHSAAYPRIVAIANNTHMSQAMAYGGHPSTLAGVARLAMSRWNSYLAIAYHDKVLNAYENGAHIHHYFTTYDSASNGCPSFRDPRKLYLASMNKLMVRFGIAAARGFGSPNLTSLDPGMEINSTVVGNVEGMHNVFHTNYDFFIGAALLELLCICLIAPTYWGWWKIGRPVSFSPLEIAKAFEAPILAEVNSNSSGLDIAKASRDRQVQYGSTVARSDGKEPNLAFADPDAVESPKQGGYFSV